MTARTNLLPASIMRLASPMAKTRGRSCTNGAVPRKENRRRLLSKIPIPYSGAHPKSFTDLQITPLTSRNRRKGEHHLQALSQMGDAMTVYVVATGLAALVKCWAEPG